MPPAAHITVIARSQKGWGGGALSSPTLALSPAMRLSPPRRGSWRSVAQRRRPDDAHAVLGLELRHQRARARRRRIAGGGSAARTLLLLRARRVVGGCLQRGEAVARDQLVRLRV